MTDCKAARTTTRRIPRILVAGLVVVRRASAVCLGDQAGPGQRAVPIASVAKVMTAYFVLRDHSLQAGEDGPRITRTGTDVADTDRRAGQDQSFASIAAGERPQSSLNPTASGGTR